MPRYTLGVAALTIMVVFPMFNRPVMAHHSQALYGTNQITLKGTVAQFDWGNPHVLVEFDVKDDKGAVVRWTGELRSVASMLAEGMTKNSLKPGDDVIMVVKPMKSGLPNGAILQIDRADGTIILRPGGREK